MNAFGQGLSSHAKCTVFEPAFTLVAADQAVLGGMAKNIIESELIGLAVTGEVGPKLFLEQPTALLQYELRLLYASRTVSFVHHIAGLKLLKTVPCGPKREYAVTDIFSADGHVFLPGMNELL